MTHSSIRLTQSWLSLCLTVSLSLCLSLSLSLCLSLCLCLTTHTHTHTHTHTCPCPGLTWLDGSHARSHALNNSSGFVSEDGRKTSLWILSVEGVHVRVTQSVRNNLGQWITARQLSVAVDRRRRQQFLRILLAQEGREGRSTLRRTSPAFGGATSITSVFSGFLGSHATAARH